MRWMSACTGALLFGVAAVSGCTTSNLKAPIGEFSKATDSAKDFLQGRQDALDKAVLAKSTELATTPGSPPVYWDGNECTLGAPSCRLFVNHADFPWPINNGALNHNVLTLMLGLSTYGKNLANIANAETATQVDTALAATKASVTALGKSADELNKTLKLAPLGLGASATKYAGPAIDLVGFALKQYLERRKLRALAVAVDDMEPVLGEIIVAFDLLAEQSVAVEQVSYDEKFRIAADNSRHAPTDKGKLNTLHEAADQYDAVLRLQPTPVFDALRTGHTELANALHHRDMTFEKLWPYLQEVFAKTSEFAGLIKKLENAAKP